MNREQLAHVLRAAAQIVDDPDILVIGSQAILGTFDDERLPVEATMSIEVDVAFWNDPDDGKADEVDGAIGELSSFTSGSGTTARASQSSRPSCLKAGELGSSPSIERMRTRAQPSASRHTTWSSPSWWQAGRRTCRSQPP